jgi:hypothetical protein
MNEEEVRRILLPREIDPDLILDPSMHGRYRMMQIERWRQEPRYFMFRDITAMAADDVVARRRKELSRLTKEGTDVRRSEDQEED